MKANAYRTKKNATIAVTFLWSFILIANIPQLFLYSSYEYVNWNETRAVCILKYNMILAQLNNDETTIQLNELKLQLYYIIFILLAYIVPLVTIVIIYALIIIKLSKSKGKSFNIFSKIKKKQKTKYNFFN